MNGSEHTLDEHFTIPTLNVTRPENTIVNSHGIDRPVLINIQTTQPTNFLPTVMLFNARSLGNKMGDLESRLSSYNNSVHIIGVTETWFSTTNPASAHQLPLFQLFAQDRCDRKGGGVALYVHQDINAREVFNNHVPSHLEVMWLHLRSSSAVRLTRDIYVCILYSPPRSQYKDELSDHIVAIVDLVTMTTHNASVMVMGDFNDLSTGVLEQQTILKQVVNESTRGDAVLDKILTDLNNDYHEPEIKAPILTVTMLSSFINH